MHRTKAQSKLLVHSKVLFKTETSSIRAIAQNSLMQHRKQNWSGEANTAKPLEISPVFFKKKSGNQSKSIKMLQLPVLLIHLVLEETWIHVKIASSILGVRGRAGARWNRMNLRNTDPMIPKTVILIVKN